MVFRACLNLTGGAAAFLLAAMVGWGQLVPDGGDQLERGKSGDFEAELYVSDDFIEGEVSPGTHRATLGDEAEIHVSFKNPARDEEGKSGVLMDCIIRRPDGSILAEARNTYGWTVHEVAPQDAMLDAECHFEIEPERTDVPGVYTAEITVKDIPGKRKVSLVARVEFRDKAP